MVSAATVAPVSASISTPVLCDTATSHRIDSSVGVANSIVKAQRSIASGWQKGISSWVRFAASVPAIIAVSTIGPFLARIPLLRSSRATAGGNLTTACAVALRAVTGLAPTSTMRGRLSASRWVMRDVLRAISAIVDWNAAGVFLPAATLRLVHAGRFEYRRFRGPCPHPYFCPGGRRVQESAADREHFDLRRV